MESLTHKRAKIIKSCLLIALNLCAPAIIKLESLHQHHCRMQQDRKRRSHLALNRFHRVRQDWSQFKNSIAKTHFRRMFRMSAECFDLLCNIIEENAGPKKFLSEDHVKSQLQEENNAKEAMMFKAHQQICGGYMCGEVKLAIALRLLAGLSCLDIACIFHVNRMHIYEIFHDMLANWICQDFMRK